MKHICAVLVLCLLVVWPGIAFGDSITVDGVLYENVIVTEGPSMYYVQIPASGSIANVDKTDAIKATVTISNGLERDTLKQTWKKNRSKDAMEGAAPAQSAAAAEQPKTPSDAKPEKKTAKVSISVRNPPDPEIEARHQQFLAGKAAQADAQAEEKKQAAADAALQQVENERQLRDAELHDAKINEINAQAEATRIRAHASKEIADSLSRPAVVYVHR